MKKIFPAVFILNFLIVLQAKAFCPVCVVVAGAGVGLSRWLGIDDTIAGTWIGGLTVAVSAWTIDWLQKKKWNFKTYKITTYLAYYLMIVAPLFFMGILGHPFNRLFGIDKIVLGIVSGSLTFYLVGAWYQVLKKKNNNRAHFPFQKVLMPVAALVILSLIFYF